MLDPYLGAFLGHNEEGGITYMLSGMRMMGEITWS